jgi:hypothetical protein
MPTESIQSGSSTTDTRPAWRDIQLADTRRAEEQLPGERSTLPAQQSRLGLVLLIGSMVLLGVGLRLLTPGQGKADPNALVKAPTVETSRVSAGR